MNNYTGEFKDIIKKIKSHPAVSIILPFEPQLFSKADIEIRFKNALASIEKKLYREFTAERCLPVISKLYKLIKEINYNYFKKSIAVFVSPFAEKIIYLDFEVNPKITIDDSFEMRDLVYCKKQAKEYLVLVISRCCSALYIGDADKLIRIKYNTADHLDIIQDHPSQIQSSFSDTLQHKEMLTDKFLHRMDQELEIILNAYPLPVFVMGTENLNKHYKNFTKTGHRISAYINGNYIKASEHEILKTLRSYTYEWNKVKQRDLLQQVQKAVLSGSLKKGIDEVWQASKHGKAKLLLIEKNFVCLAVKTFDKLPDKVDSEFINPFYIKDAVDDIIEKYLKMAEMLNL